MKIIDLSETIFSGMIVYPGDPEVVFEKKHSIQREGWRLQKLTFGSHTGTHVDAFSHMDSKGQFLNKIPLKKFFGLAQVVDISGKFPLKKGLLFSSGKLGLSLFNKIIQVKPIFVGCSVNCDLSVDLERQLLKSGILTFTDLVNVDKLPQNKDFMFYGFPLKLKGMDGSPIRAVAIIN